jgi:hypothetical protein
MAGTPAIKQSSVIKDYGQSRKFLRDMRAKAARNSGASRKSSART